jgi:hypothetical protein
MHGRNCSGFSTLASGRWHGKVYANSSHVGKKLRIHAGIHIIAPAGDFLSSAPGNYLKAFDPDHLDG